MESDLLLRESEKVKQAAEAAGTDFYAALPPVLRERDEVYLRRLTACLSRSKTLFRGVLVRNLEALAYIRTLREKEADVYGSYAVVSDAGLYCFNSESAYFLCYSSFFRLSEFAAEITLPYELNAGEAMHLVRAAGAQGIVSNLIVYSRIPMMITANCLRKTAGYCPPQGDRQGQIFLKDRYGAAFPVVINCDHCYNVIYNSVPYSLHEAKKERDRIGAGAFRYDFVTETGAQCRQILEGSFPFESYTAGHCRRGIV